MSKGFQHTKKINFAVLYSHQAYIAHQGTNYEFVISFLYTLSVYDPEMIVANETIFFGLKLLCDWKDDVYTQL